MSDGKYEPTSNMRQFARSNFDMFQAHMQAGFTEYQALTIIGMTIAAAFREDGQNGD